ncbi:hypothetical protein GGF50DRAFT_41557, partial [Schizophyllum commune]
RLLRDYILPSFINALDTRRKAFDWAPGRENELQRLACSLLLIPQRGPFWERIDRDQYCTCVSRVLQALSSALYALADSGADADVATSAATLLALGNRLDNLYHKSELLKNGALCTTITMAYASLTKRDSSTVLRLRPVIWRHMLTYLVWDKTLVKACPQFAVFLWRNCSDWECLFQTRLQKAIHRLLCPSTCKFFIDDTIGSVVFNGDLCFLVEQYLSVLLTSLDYNSVDSALNIIRHASVSSLYQSVLLRAGSSLVESVTPGAALPTPLTQSLFWFLVELLAAVDNSTDDLDLSTALPKDNKAVMDTALALDRYIGDYYQSPEVLAYVASGPVDTLELLTSVARVILNNPPLALLAIVDAFASMLAPLLHAYRRTYDGAATPVVAAQELEDPLPFILMDVLCAARSSTFQPAARSSASDGLHKALLALKAEHVADWQERLKRYFSDYGYIPLSLALALRSRRGREVLAEFLDDERFTKENLSAATHLTFEVCVPDLARQGQDKLWYGRFTVNPDRYCSAQVNDRIQDLPISELVTFEEYKARMDAEEANRLQEGDVEDGDGAGREDEGQYDQG